MELIWYIILGIVGLAVSTAISYFVIYYAVKSANKDLCNELEMMNQFMIRGLMKAGVSEKEIDEDIFYVFPEEEENIETGADN